jgi:putative DNA methylase
LVCLNVFAFDARKLDSLRYPDNEIMTTQKKLIEVALPLEAINKAAAREKSIRHGHPSTLHLWWARRPLAAARAVIFAQMVDDPSGYVDTLKSDPKLLQKAERVLKARHKLWEEQRAAFEKAEAAGIAATNPGREPTLEDILAEQERQRLFDIIGQIVLERNPKTGKTEEVVKGLVAWESTTDEKVLQKARDEIWQSWRRACAENADHPRAKELFDRHKLPAFHDPFAGGGALPLEAQRLGLESYASDLNPVAVLINKAMIEIPPRFANKPPVNPAAQNDKQLFAKGWRGAQGLAEDVRYYGKWMRDEAEKRIGHLYPRVEVTAEMAKGRPDLKPYVGKKLTVIAWLWARTVRSPNPAFADVEVPLASTFMLSTKAGKEAYVEPVIEGGGYRFTVKVGKPKDAQAAKNGTKLARGANFRCLMSGTPIAADYIKAEGQAGRMGARLMAIVAEGERGRVYLAPTPEHEAAARQAKPEWRPESALPDDPRNFWTVQYGLKTYGDLFSPRQLVALTTFSDLVGEAMARVKRDALAAGLPDDGQPLRDGGTGATAYAEAVGVYLAFLVNQVANHSSSVCGWNNANTQMRSVFARQAIPMVWDFAESNPFCESSGSYSNLFERQVKGFEALGLGATGAGHQADVNQQSLSADKLVSTDPPYYDNIGYADLSDFFYVWLRRSLRPVFPDLFATLAVPKAEELVATPYRHGGKEAAERFFLDGMTQAMHRLAEQAHPAFPVTIYYAFKQSETETAEGTSSTGWETFLDAVIRSGFAIAGTWPIRTEKQGRVIGNDTNALASSIILVCRPRPANAPTATRREFVAALKAELPQALAHLQAGNIAPVDLAQAAIGPGMAVYTRYAKVLDAEGRPLSVREALALINATLDEALAEQEGDFDADSRWALAWFEQHGFAEGEYGVAETLSKAKNTSVAGMVEAGIVQSARGKVRLLRPDELPAGWDPATDPRLTAWEIVHHLVRVLNQGEQSAAALAAALGARAEVARELAYRLYTMCERKKRAAEALAYNSLVQSWPEIVRLAQEEKAKVQEQGELFGDA